MRTVNEIMKDVSALTSVGKSLPRELIDEYNQATYREECDIEYENYHRLSITEDISCERLGEICQAEREGRCVVLPCKVGDTVYKLWYKPCHNGEDFPDGMGCCGCEDECDIEKAIFEVQATSESWILKTFCETRNNSVYFLTREAAETALKK